MPKVTIVVGGRWHAFDLAVGLKKLGFLHRLITNYPWYKVKKWGLDYDDVVTLPLSGVINHFVQRYSSERLRVRSQHRIHSLFARSASNYLSGADIVDGLSSFALPSIRVCKRLGTPFVLQRLSSHIETQSEILSNERRAFGINGAFTHKSIVEMELAEYSTADAIVVPSQFAYRTFLDRGVSASRLHRNPFGVDQSIFRPRGKLDQGENFTVIYAGTLGYRKGLHYLLEGFRKAGVPNSKLLLVGGTTDETARILRCPPEGTIRVGHVPQSQLVNYYVKAHAFVMASVEEGLAMVQVQALACGLPLICTENTGGEDLLQMVDPLGSPANEPGGIRRYAAGFVIPIRDPSAIAHCIKRLAQDKTLRASQSQAALAIRKSALDWSDYASRAAKIYESVLNTHPKAINCAESGT
jgi:starch synthase